MYFQPPYYAELFHGRVMDIPKSDRRWYPKKRVWAFKAALLGTIISLVRDEYFSTPEVEETQCQTH